MKPNTNNLKQLKLKSFVVRPKTANLMAGNEENRSRACGDDTLIHETGCIEGP